MEAHKNKKIIICSRAFCFFLFLISMVYTASAADFVKVNGTNFYLKGRPFYFAGTNAYYLWYGSIDCSSPQTNQGCVIPLLDDAKSLNLTVIRTWGFCNGVYKYGYCFQPGKGAYHEATFAHFDRVIKEASDRNLKLIIPLVNNWNDFGGMCQYVWWCNQTIPYCANESVHDMFYTDNCVKTLYKNYTRYFLNRTNTLTGIKYKDDPTILAWELANEPRARSDITGATLNNWIGEMSAYIKSIDPNHLVTTGVDGGYLNKGSDPFAWWYKGNEGQDYYANHNWSAVDFAAFHYYSDMDPSINVNTWIQEHIEDAHNVIRKPVLFEEFNTKTNMAQTLAGWYSKMESYGIDGDTFWMLSDNYFAGNNDGYYVLCPENATICQVILNHSNYMNYRSNGYNVSQVIIGSAKEYRFYFGDHHFLTIIDSSGTFNIRPHPGVDANGWGSSLYMQPFLPGATLKYSSIQDITPVGDKIRVRASGYVSRGAASAYGRWNASMNFSYDPAAKKVSGNGSYKVVLDGALSAGTGDLNLFKIASNYLDNVPLLTGITGDTGDMQYANVTLSSLNFIWNPPAQPSYFPQDNTDYLSINVLGQLNNVDTAAQGYAAIDPAYKPGMEVVLASQQAGIPMIFGGIYDTGKSQYFWEDNVGITPLILKESSFTEYNFDLKFSSLALPNDGIDADFDSYNYSLDCNDNNISVYPGAAETCNGIDDNCDGQIDEGDACRFSIKNSTGGIVAWFSYAGNVVLKGALQQSSSYAATSNDEFRIQDRNSNDIAIIDLISGNMYIDGALSESQGSLNPSQDSDDFMIQDSSGNAVAYINESGYMFLKGTLTQNGSP